MARFRRFRRFRRRGTWLPLLGTAGAGGENPPILPYTRTDLSVPNDGTTFAVSVVPIIYDVPQEAPYGDPAAHGLSTIVGNEAIIDGIVGTIFVARDITTGTSPDVVNGPYAIDVWAGIFVARADNPEGIGVSLPAGWLAGPNDQHNFNPGLVDTAREPWMWRRFWRLGLLHGTVGSTEPFLDPVVARNVMTLGNEAMFPTANWYYANSETGCGVRVKTRRRIGNDDRLWLILAGKAADASDEPAAVSCYADIRIHGALRRARNKSTF